MDQVATKTKGTQTKAAVWSTAMLSVKREWKRTPLQTTLGMKQHKFSWPTYLLPNCTVAGQLQLMFTTVTQHEADCNTTTQWPQQALQSQWLHSFRKQEEHIQCLQCYTAISSHMCSTHAMMSCHVATCPTTQGSKTMAGDYFLVQNSIPAYLLQNTCCMAREYI